MQRQNWVLHGNSAESSSHGLPRREEETALQTQGAAVRKQHKFWGTEQLQSEADDLQQCQAYPGREEQSRHTTRREDRAHAFSLENKFERIERQKNKEKLGNTRKLVTMLIIEATMKKFTFMHKKYIEEQNKIKLK